MNKLHNNVWQHLAGDCFNAEILQDTASFVVTMYYHVFVSRCLIQLLLFNYVYVCVDLGVYCVAPPCSASWPDRGPTHRSGPSRRTSASVTTVH